MKDENLQDSVRLVKVGIKPTKRGVEMGLRAAEEARTTLARKIAENMAPDRESAAIHAFAITHQQWASHAKEAAEELGVAWEPILASNFECFCAERGIHNLKIRVVDGKAWVHMGGRKVHWGSRMYSEAPWPDVILTQLAPAKYPRT